MTLRNESDGPTTSELRMAEALTALICHDLSGPLGAMVSALELAQEPATATEALTLARDATTRMVQQLQLMRASWAGPSAAVSRATLKGLVAGLPARVDVVIDALGGELFEESVARVLLNAIMIAAAALPKGGTIAVAGDVETGIAILPIGHGAAWPSYLFLGLVDPQTCLSGDPRRVQVPFFSYLAQAAGIRATLLLPPGITAATCQPLLLARLT